MSQNSSAAPHCSERVTHSISSVLSMSSERRKPCVDPTALRRLTAATRWHSNCSYFLVQPFQSAMSKSAHAVLVCSWLVGLGCAQTPTMRVLPWNDHPAAVSLTFDDARPVHLDVVVPELNSRHLHATFFVIVSKLTRMDDWRRVQAQGHEIGNHSVTHEHPVALTKASEQLEVEDAKKFLESNFR